MIRVPASSFRASRAQRRCSKQNADLVLASGAPSLSEEKQALYSRYLDARHDGQMEGSLTELRGFLYSSPLETLEVTYSLGGRLVAVGVADVEPLALSAVYCYFEPLLGSRSLGVFNVLTLIEECRRRGVPHLYLGYYVRGCAKMDYKALFRPCEILEPGRGYVRYEAAPR